MNCIVLGDKFTKGTKSKGCCGLIKINNTTNLIENQYKVLQRFEFSNIVYVYGFDSEKFLNYIQESKINTINIYNPNYNKYNYAHSLKMSCDFLNGDILIINGYQKVSNSIIKKINLNSRTSQVLVKPISHNDTPGCIIRDNSIHSFGYGLSNSVADIYYLNKDATSSLSDLISSDKYNHYFIFELLNIMIDQGTIFKSIYI